MDLKNGVMPPGRQWNGHRARVGTLYMGGPIVVRTLYMQALLEHIPVVWVSHWIEITEQGFLEKSGNNLNSKPHDANRLRLSWWRGFMWSSVTPSGMT